MPDEFDKTLKKIQSKFWKPEEMFEKLRTFLKKCSWNFLKIPSFLETDFKKLRENLRKF